MPDAHPIYFWYFKMGYPGWRPGGQLLPGAGPGEPDRRGDGAHLRRQEAAPDRGGRHL